jgi:diaminopimelate epimerase
MHGLGNDFIVVDCRKKNIKKTGAVMKALSNRRFGIGFDQAIILKASKKADFSMDIYNGDGTRVEMCGNGIRCLAAYIWNRGLSKKKRLDIETLAGIIRPEKYGKLVRVDMGKPVLEGRLIPALADGMVKDYGLKAGDKTFKITCVSMGNPHCVIFVDDVDAFEVEKYGPLIETDKFFPKRTNVEFIQVLSSKRLKMRVWERGSGETLACGTGACASAVAGRLHGFTGQSVSVMLRGGALKIDLAKDDHVYMTGPAEEVYDGEVEI